MSEEKITPKLLGARLMALTINAQDVQLRLTSLESRLPLSRPAMASRKSVSTD